MINILLGAPGGGKSYEAVCYHVLPALQRGRKVITNLPLFVDQFEAIEPGSSALIELRTSTLAVAPAESPESENLLMGMLSRARASKFVARAFANHEDYASEWRAADGTGPLYVVDECHFSLPKVGTQRAVEEWFSMHRHFNADVLLITQSSGKISPAIKDLVQVCYKVRKAVAFGKSDSYIRKVLDGVNGGEVAVSERKYRPEIFKLYRSHTQGLSIGEAQADDVDPFIVKFRRATRLVLALGLCGLVGVGFYIYYGGGPVVASKPAKLVLNPKTGQHEPAWLAGAVADYKANPPKGDDDEAVAPRSAASEPLKPGETPEPYANKSLHLTGHLSSARHDVYTFAVGQNGLVVSTLTDQDLRRAGYKWAPLTDCAGTLTWGEKSVAVTCDAPQVSMSATQPLPRAGS